MAGKTRYIHIPPELDEWLEAEAVRVRRSVTMTIRVILEAAKGEQEAAKGEQEAEEPAYAITQR